jgi:hypothetical protein
LFHTNILLVTAEYSRERTDVKAVRQIARIQRETRSDFE